MIPRADFIAAVRSCIGTRVGHHGRAIGKALDCGGVPWAAAKACGLDLAETPRYARRPSGADLTNVLAKFCDRVEDEEAAHVFQVMFEGEPRHVAVPVGVNGAGQTIVVVALVRNRRVVETVLAAPVAARWRIRGIE